MVFKSSKSSRLAPRNLECGGMTPLCGKTQLAACGMANSKLRLASFVSLVLVSTLSSALAADPPWAIQDAPMRAAFRAANAPTTPEAGWLLEVPELGITTPTMSDVVLADAKGNQLPLAKISRMEAHKLL